VLYDLPRHGLGDIRSFEWSVDGDRIVVDQGVYECRNGLPVIALHEFGATVREGADGLHLQGLTEAKQAHELQLALVQAYQVLLFHASYHLKFQLPVIDRFAGLLPACPLFLYFWAPPNCEPRNSRGSLAICQAASSADRSGPLARGRRINHSARGIRTARP
jgi:hypothetical protein